MHSENKTLKNIFKDSLISFTNFATSLKKIILENFKHLKKIIHNVEIVKVLWYLKRVDDKFPLSPSLKMFGVK
jgi:hypothetical protein